MKLTLDFVPSRQLPVKALVLLIAAGAIALVLLAQWLRVHQESMRLQSELARIELVLNQKQREARKRNEVTPEMAARMKLENRIMAALQYPWNYVLSTLERSDMTGIAVLSFVHEQSASRTQLTVEAVDIEALTRFVDSMNEGIEQGDRWYISSYQVQQQGNPVTIKATVFSK